MEDEDESRIILPPPVVREIIDKTAGFVVKNGRAFETRIASSAQGNTLKFAFLAKTHPYHDYYEQTIVDLKAAGKGNPPVIPSTPSAAPTDALDPAASTATEAAAAAAAAPPPPPMKAIESFEVVPFAIRTVQPDLAQAPLPMDSFLLERPDWVDARVDDIIKLVARYVAAGGESFISGLAARESRNPDFAFLQTGHGLHSYYQRVLTSYRTSLQPTDTMTSRLSTLAADPTGHANLQECLYRLRWSEKQVQDREHDHDAAETQHAMANIDWHDFVIAATIDFEEEKEGEAGEAGGLLQQGTTAPGGPTVDGSLGDKGDRHRGAEDDEEDDHGMDISDEEEEEEEEVEEVVDTSDIQVVDNYVPVVSGRTKNNAQSLDPATGLALHADEVAEHLRIELLDPAWKKQRDVFIAKQKNTNQISDGDNIANNLKRFANNRPDIFQDDDANQEGAGGGTKSSSNKSSSSSSSSSAAPVVWDGRTGSIAQVREAAQQAQEEMRLHEAQLRATGQHPDQQQQGSGIGPAPYRALALPQGLPPSMPGRAPGGAPGGPPGLLPPPVVTVHQAAAWAREAREARAAKAGQVGQSGGSGGAPAAKKPRMNGGVLQPEVAKWDHQLPSRHKGTMPIGTVPTVVGPLGAAPLAAAPVGTVGPVVVPPPMANMPPQDSAVLIPGDEWLELCNGQLDLLVTVTVPNDAGHATDWNTCGQTLSVATDVTSTVLSLKETIRTKLGGSIPLNKFQLKHGLRGYIKDKLKFTDLNFRHSVLLEMSLKSRKRRR